MNDRKQPLTEDEFNALDDGTDVIVQWHLHTEPIDGYFVKKSRFGHNWLWCYNGTLPPYQNKDNPHFGKVNTIDRVWVKEELE